MLYHLSFNVQEPERVARVLAEILGATVVRAPSPPFNEGAIFVCCGDERGTMVSLEPWGVAYEPGPGARTDMPTGRDPRATSAVHGLFLASVPQDQIEAIAARESWPCGLCDNGPFKVINLWLEGRQLLEFTTPELLPAYLATFGSEGVKTLDRGLRKQEEMLRALMAG